MSLVDNLRKELFQARKDKDETKSEILQLAIAAIGDESIKVDGELSKDDEVKVVKKIYKKSQDAYTQYSEAGRDDLAEKEEAQMKYLEQYLPEQMAEDDIRVIVEKKISETEATSMRDMGIVMKEVMAEIGDDADGGVVSDIVKELLS